MMGDEDKVYARVTDCNESNSLRHLVFIALFYFLFFRITIFF